MCSVCPVCALARQRDRALAVALRCGVDPDCAPLFPTSDGLEVDRGAAVATIEAIVRAYGELTQDELGCSLCGGHFLRTGGAFLLASLGVNPHKIQALGRWRSSLVIQYAGEAMHSGIARDLGSADSPGLSALSDAISRLERRLLQLEETVPAGPVPGEQGSYIVNVETRCLHYTRASPAWPAELQRTSGCGWIFLQHRFQREQLRPGGFSWRQVCSRCLPEYRAELRGAVSNVVVDSD